MTWGLVISFPYEDLAVLLKLEISQECESLTYKLLMEESLYFLTGE